MNRPRTVRFVAALIIGLTGAAPLAAQEPQNEQPPPPKPARLFAEIQFTSAYYYRGFVQETHGLIAQPAFRGELDLFQTDTDQTLRRVSAVLGIRNSLHSEHTLADGNGPDIWYEADIIAGLQFQIHDRWTVETLYAAITSPNGAWDTIREIDLQLAYDDTGLWNGDFSTRPYAKFAFEMDGSAAAGEEGTYLELGVEPGFGLIRSKNFPVRISFPIRLGLSLDKYYVSPFGGPDDTFGYLKTGVSFTTPFTFIPPEHGRWALTVGADAIYLGDNLETFNHNDDTDLIGRISIGAQF